MVNIANDHEAAAVVESAAALVTRVHVELVRVDVEALVFLRRDEQRTFREAHVPGRRGREALPAIARERPPPQAHPLRRMDHEQALAVLNHS